ncbi:MAG TPA: hypothetical protein VFU46_12700 [Gemmatimonadales bacterium]|nr:hypothetical protein [Gemmatimonadales bacterium]
MRVLGIEEHLARFRRDLPAVDGLTSGAGSPQALAGRFLRAIERSDSLDLARMALSAEEYAWLYYPSHIYHDPPYELDPETFWLLIQGNSEKGYLRVLRALGGRRLEFGRLDCALSSNVRKPLREWHHCVVRFRADGSEQARRLFGSIVGYRGSYKFVSYANEF